MHPDLGMVNEACSAEGVTYDRMLPLAQVLGVDSSAAGVELAQHNAELNGVAASCSFVKADVGDFMKQVKHYLSVSHLYNGSCGCELGARCCSWLAPVKCSLQATASRQIVLKLSLRR